MGRCIDKQLGQNIYTGDEIENLENYHFLFWFKNFLFIKYTSNGALCIRESLSNNINQLFIRFRFILHLFFFFFFVFKIINTRDSLIDIFLSCFNLLHILNYIEKRFFVLIIILHSKRTKTIKIRSLGVYFEI